MATPKFQPHGFIDTPQLEVQYRTAHFSNYHRGIHDPKEAQTVKLLENIFNKVIFFGNKDVFINSQQPPEINSRKACDIVIEYTESETFHTRVLCFIECKRTKKTTGYDLEQVEKQALEYCTAYLESDDNLSVVYACTAIGAHIRCWRLVKGDKAFLGFWGGPSPAAWDQYKDVGVDADAALIRWAIDYMIALPPTGREGQAIEDYGSIYAGQGKQPAGSGSQNQSLGTQQPAQAIGPPREVAPTMYPFNDTYYLIFSLDGEQKSTWQSEWSSKEASDGRLLAYHAVYNVFYYP